MRRDLRAPSFARVVVSDGLTRLMRAPNRIKRVPKMALQIAAWLRPLLAILLNARRAQSGKAVLVDGVLPREELFNRQRVAAAGLFERQQPAPDGGNDFGFAADDPTFRPRRRQIGNGQGRAVRPDHIFNPRAMGFSHRNSRVLDNSTAGQSTGPDLRFT